jgi:hypothetical protein
MKSTNIPIVNIEAANALRSRSLSCPVCSLPYESNARFPVRNHVHISGDLEIHL